MTPKCGHQFCAPTVCRFDSGAPALFESVEHRGGQVAYTLKGDDAKVRARVEAIFSEYPPTGYGTRVTVYQDRTIVSRAASCD